MLIFDLTKRIHHAILEELYIKPFARRNSNRNINAKNTIALICHPRGGSNWLGEILLNIRNSILIDEPLWRGFYRDICYMPPADVGKIKSLSKLNFYLDQHIPTKHKWQKANKVIESILKGEIVVHDLYDRNKLSSLKDSDVYIFKFCFAHLLFPWIHENFDLKSIVMHRHPCAVVASQLQYPVFNYIPSNPTGNIPDFQFNYIHKQYDSVWKNIKTKEEYLAAIWAVKTKYALQHRNYNSYSLTIFYEELLTNFEENMQILIGFLDKDITNDIIQNRPSVTSSSGTEEVNKNQQLEKWRSQLSNQQIKRILDIVEKFDIEIYDDSLMPKPLS